MIKLFAPKKQPELGQPGEPRQEFDFSEPQETRKMRQPKAPKPPKPPKPPRQVRDLNYYFGLLLLTAGILSLGVYLLMDKTGLFNAFFNPLSFLITFLICAWGFVLLWKSDTDYRFKLAQNKIKELEDELSFIKKLM